MNWIPVMRFYVGRMASHLPTRPDTPAALSPGRYSLILPPAVPGTPEVHVAVAPVGRYERITERPARAR